MSGEKEERLFEELDFGSFIGELEEMVGEEAIEDSAESTEEEINEDSEDGLQGAEEPAEGASSTEDSEENKPEEADSEESEEVEDNSSPLTPYAKLLVEEGILPNFNFEDFDGTSDGLTKAMEKEITTGVENYKSQLPEEIKQLVDNYEEGVPLSRLLELEEKRTEYKSIKSDQLSESKDLQKAVLRDYYKNTSKFTEKKIDKLIQTADDLETLSSESSEALEELVKLQDQYEADELEQAKVSRVQAQKAQEQAIEDFKKTLNKSDEIIPSIKVSQNTKDTIFKVMTTPVSYDEAGNPMNKIAAHRAENPYEYDIMVSYLFEVTKGFKDWSVLSSAGKTSAAKSFEKAIERQNYKSSTGKGGSPSNAPKNSSDLLDEISKIKF